MKKINCIKPKKVKQKKPKQPKQLKPIKQTEYDAQIIKQQAERISELKTEIDVLEKALEVYRKRERDVVDTVDFARKKGDEYVAMIKIKYALECERIRRFKERLEKFRTRDELIRCYDTAFGELNAWLDEMERTIANDFGSAMTDYISERKRLNTEPELDYTEITKRLKTDLSEAGQLSEEDLKDLLDQL